MNKNSKILISVSIVILIYWIMAKIIDVYKYPVLGAVYEITSLIFLILTFVVCVITIVFWVKNKFSLNKYYILPVIISIISILVLFFLHFFYSN